MMSYKFKKGDRAIVIRDTRAPDVSHQLKRGECVTIDNVHSYYGDEYNEIAVRIHTGNGYFWFKIDDFAHDDKTADNLKTLEEIL